MVPTAYPETLKARQKSWPGKCEEIQTERERERERERENKKQTDR